MVKKFDDTFDDNDDTSSRFDIILACDRQTDIHLATA